MLHVTYHNRPLSSIYYRKWQFFEDALDFISERHVIYSLAMTFIGNHPI